MEISDKGLNLIQNFEGFAERIYKCPADYWTIGFGHRVLSTEMDLYKNKVLSVPEALNLLQIDLKACYSAISKLVLVPLAQGQFDALCSFIFNEGEGKFLNSTMHKMLNRGNYAGASLEFPKWVYARDKTGKKVVLQGLVKRRLAEQRLFNG